MYVNTQIYLDIYPRASWWDGLIPGPHLDGQSNKKHPHTHASENVFCLIVHQEQKLVSVVPFTTFILI